MRRPEGFDGPPRRPRAPSPEPEASGGDRLDDAAAPDATETRPVEPVRDEKPLRPGESHAARADRLHRAAELRRLRFDRAEARRAARRVQVAERARRRVERAEVRRFTGTARRRVRIALIAVGALVGSFALLVGLVSSPLMAVRTIEVRGTERLDPAAIQAALQAQLGQPIATVTDAQVRAELEQFTGLRSFAVDVVPPGTIVVRVVEREPVLVASVDGSDTLLDPAGVALGDPAGAALPRLENVEVGSPAFEAITASLVAMPASLRERIATITASTPDDVRMRLVDGERVVWGGAEDAVLKADVLGTLLTAADPALDQTFDVSAPEYAVVR